MKARIESEPAKKCIRLWITPETPVETMLLFDMAKTQSAMQPGREMFCIEADHPLFPPNEPAAKL